MTSLAGNQTVSHNTIYRLSTYSDALRGLTETKTETVSSEELSIVTGVNPAQIRKDLAHFGQFGKRGLGYNVKILQKTITRLLGTHYLQPIILVGAGNLGRALLAYEGFRKAGFEIIAAFDSAPRQERLTHLKISLFPMSRLERFVYANNVRMAILCVPATVAQKVATRLAEVGIRAILNFAPVILSLPENIKVGSVNFAAELEHLNYFLQGKKNVSSLSS